MIAPSNILYRIVLNIRGHRFYIISGMQRKRTRKGRKGRAEEDTMVEGREQEDGDVMKRRKRRMQQPHRSTRP